MQSYKVNIVSEHLKDRHPYLELPFVDRYDNTEVYHAVFDRAIPKLVEILLMKGLENIRYQDALLTLNEMVSHQENKDQMISMDLVEISSFFCHHRDVGIRREAMLLLGSLVTIMRGRERMNKHTYDGLSNMLFDEHLEARVNCAWAISRVAMSRDGVDLFVKNQTIAAAIDSFLRYTETLRDVEGKFYVYLLETFSYFLQFDSGIEFFIGKGILRRVNDILERKDDSSLKEYKRRIQYLCLEFTMKFTTNHEGKEEGIQEKVILTASKYLMSDYFEEVKFAAMVIMTSSILLEGKMQCVENPNDKIIKDLIVLLDRDNQDLRRYVKNALTTICEYPKGALLITKYLSKHINYLDEIFSIKMIKHLAVELPKAAELSQPPILPSDRAEELKIYANAIGHFLKKYEEAVAYACENTFKLSERLAPFLLYKNDKTLQELTANALYKICKHDEYNRGFLHAYFEKTGTVKHPTLGTTLSSEIAKFTKLYQLIENKLS